MLVFKLTSQINHHQSAITDLQAGRSPGCWRFRSGLQGSGWRTAPDRPIQQAGQVKRAALRGARDTRATGRQQAGITHEGRDLIIRHAWTPRILEILSNLRKSGPSRRSPLSFPIVGCGIRLLARIFVGHREEPHDGPPHPGDGSAMFVALSNEIRTASAPLRLVHQGGAD